MAKVYRDRIIADLSNEQFNVGSGYPSDPTTIEALKELTRGTPATAALDVDNFI